MTQFLPPNLLALFAPREPIPFKPPVKTLSWEKDRSKTPFTGVAEFVERFEDPKDTPPPTRGETKAEKKLRRMREKEEKRKTEVEEEMKLWDPHNDPNATGDAFKTLFVARINYDTSEAKLRREFEKYGKIKKVNMVRDAATNKPRGYAFIEFEKERDMHAAYKSGDGRKIDGRRVLVDVERGRTVKGWRPRRLGGGLGNTRIVQLDEEEAAVMAATATSKETERPTETRSRESSRYDSDKRRSRPRDSRRDRSDRGDRDRTSGRDRSRDRERRRRDRDREPRSGRASEREGRSRRDDDAGGKEHKRDDHKRSTRHRERSRDRDRHRDRSDRGGRSRDTKSDSHSSKQNGGEGDSKKHKSHESHSRYKSGASGDGPEDQRMMDVDGFKHTSNHQQQGESGASGEQGTSMYSSADGYGNTGYDGTSPRRHH